jgi:hypothetical protein
VSGWSGWPSDEYAVGVQAKPERFFGLFTPVTPQLFNNTGGSRPSDVSSALSVIITGHLGVF